MDNVESHSNWHNGITKQIDLLKEMSDRHNYRKYKIDMLQCLANRVDQFTYECGQCQMFKQDLTTLVQDVGSLSQMSNKESRKQYFKSINNIIAHFQKQHKLVTDGYYIGLGMIFGVSIGIAIGTAMDSIGSGIPIGIGVGVGIGSALEAKAKKEDRILCPSQAKAITTSRRSLVIVGIFVALLAVGILAFTLFNRSG